MTQKVTFNLSENIVSNATSGVLVGDFNNWNPEQGVELKKQKNGSMKTTLVLEAGKTYQYRYLLNDGRWVNDSNADTYAYAHEFFIDNCVITVPGEAPKAVKTKKETPVPVKEIAPVVKKVVIKKVAVTTTEPLKKVTMAKKEVIEVAAPAKKAASKTVKAKK